VIALGDAPAPAVRKPNSDSVQTKRVYASERVLGSDRFDTIEEVQAYVDGLTSADWWFQPLVRRVECVHITDKRFHYNHGGTQLDRGKGTIWLIDFSISTILHEVAHTITDEDVVHGVEFVRNYLKIVFHVLGSDEYVKLYESLKAGGCDL
jgi:putative metallohydrolase (TIGR04338 family)